MIRLLEIEFKKIIKYRTFQILIGLFVASFVLFMSAASSFLKDLKFDQFSLPMQKVLEYPDIWNFLFWGGSLVTIVVFGYLIIILTCNEFETRTFRQHVIDGLDLEEVLLSKFLLILSFLFFSITLIFLLGLVFGNSGEDGFLFNKESFSVLVLYSIKVFLYLSLAFIIAQWVRKTGTSLFIFLFWPFIVEPIIGYMIDKYIAGFSEWLPSAIAGKLVPNPFQEAVRSEVLFNASITGPAIGLIFLFWTLNWLKLKYSDL